MVATTFQLQRKVHILHPKDGGVAEEENGVTGHSSITLTVLYGKTHNSVTEALLRNSNFQNHVGRCMYHQGA